MHGDKDTLIDISGGRRTAALIPGAKFVEIEGMGHDYPPELWERWVDEVATFCLGARPAPDVADDRLRVTQALVVAGLVRHEAVAVGIQQLDDLVRLTPVPRVEGCERARRVVGVDHREHAPQVVVEQSDQLDAERDLRPAS